MTNPTQQQITAALAAYDDTIGFKTPTFVLRIEAIKAALVAAANIKECGNVKDDSHC